MLVIRIQPHIAAGAVLSELERVPAVRLFETGEAHISIAQRSGLEKAFERFGETISQHLNGGGRHLLTPPALELCGQIVLGGEGAPLCILPFDGLKHLVIERARRDQALHEQVGLFVIWIQAVFKRSHRPTLAG